MLDTLDHQYQAHQRRLLDRYRALLDKHGFSCIAIFSGAGRRFHADDQAPSFQAFAHFRHWVPLQDVEHSWVLIYPDRPPVLYLHAPDDTWQLPLSLPEADWPQHFDVHLFDVHLNKTQALPTLDANSAVIGDPEALRAWGGCPAGHLNPGALLHALDEGRIIKSAYEISCLREANRLAMAGHQAAEAAFFAAASELDIHLSYLAASRQRETQLPYPSIIGINEHASVLHYQHLAARAPRTRYSLLADAGVRFKGYCADVTRTYAGPDAPARFKSLISAVDDVKTRMIKRMQPGAEFIELHARMHHELADVLVEQGLFAGSREAAVRQGVTRAFCPHGLGHSVGLQVHDVGGWSDPEGGEVAPPAKDPALRLTRALVPGMVVTVEPGLYFITSLLAPLREARLPIDWALVDQLRPCGGIRMEEAVAIKDDGNVNLTQAARSA